MSRIRANTIVNGAGTGAPDFPRGAIISGISTITADIQSDNINITGVVTATSANFTGNVSIGGTLSYDDVTNIDSIGIVTARDGLDTPTNLVLRTGGTEKLRITSDGKIGVGTIDPQRDLHIHNSDSSTNTYLQLTSATTGTTSSDGFQLWAYGSGGNQNAVIAQRENADIEIWTNNTERLRINNSGYMTTAPSGMMIRSGFYDTGTGSGASTQVSSSNWTTINIDGTNQKLHNITKFSSDGLAYNKVSSNSHLNVTINFPFYYDDIDAGNGGFGVRCLFSTDDGANYHYLSDLSQGPCDGWGAGAYGGTAAGVFTYTWNSRMNGTQASTVLAKTGNIRFYWQTRIWSGTSNLYMIGYANYSKKGSIIIQEIAE